jgi:hypothetical protein
VAEINQNLQKEGKLYNKEFRNFKGVFTQASRNAIPDGTFYHLENLQPIGDANLHSIEDISAALHDYAADAIYWAQYVNIGGVDYLLNFASNGKVFAFNTTTLSSTLVTAALSGSGTRVTQWKNSQALFIDSTGYYNWDGTTFTLITGSGVPSAGTEIAVYSGRVWIWNGRLLVISAADDYTAAAWLAVNGASFVNLTDPTLRSVVIRAIAANGYLYFAGTSSVNVISNVYVPSGASPPAPLLTNTNIQSTLGTDQPGSFFTVDDRDLYFANPYGIYLLRGVSADRISEDIDGTWQYRDGTQGNFGGAVNSNNILHAVILMKRLNDPIFGSNTILCLYADEKWWFANYGALTLITGAVVLNQPALYGFIGNKLYKLFANAASAPVFTIKTALWPMEDALADKQVIRAGFEITLQTLIAQLTATIDTVTASLPFLPTALVGTVQWINNASQVVTWQNNALQPVHWLNGQYLLYWSGNSTPGAYNKYVGMTITGQAIFEISGIFMDYKLGARWGGGVQ